MIVRGIEIPEDFQIDFDKGKAFAPATMSLSQKQALLDQLKPIENGLVYEDDSDYAAMLVIETLELDIKCGYGVGGPECRDLLGEYIQHQKALKPGKYGPIWKN